MTYENRKNAKKYMMDGILVGDKNILVAQILLKNLIVSDVGSQSSSVL